MGIFLFFLNANSLQSAMLRKIWVWDLNESLRLKCEQTVLKFVRAGFSLVLHSSTATLRRALPVCAFSVYNLQDKHLTDCINSSTNFGQIKKN